MYLHLIDQSGSCKNQNGFWGVTVEYHKFNEVVVVLAAAMPDIVLLLEQSYTASGMW